MTPLLNTRDICDTLRIKRTTFDIYKRQLLQFGLFQRNGRGSGYLMRAEDFEKYINSKL